MPTFNPTNLTLFNDYLQMKNAFLLNSQNPNSNYITMNTQIKNTVYLNQKGQRITTPGALTETIIQEICQHKNLNCQKTGIPPIQIPTAIQTLRCQKAFQVDGAIFNNSQYPDLYIESKCFGFGSEGTAHEKLPGFLDKARLYNKPVLLILSGIFEVWGQTFSSNVLLSLCQNPPIPTLTAAEQQEINDSFIGQAARQLMQKTTPEGTPWLQITTLSNFINF